MALNRSTIIATVSSHALGGDPDARSAEDLANMAGREMLSMRSWQWAIDVAGTADLVADQEYADLPADFLAFVTEPRFSTTAWGTIQLVGIQTIEDYRSVGVGNTGRPTWGALTRVSTPGSAFAYRLQLWPVPSTSETDGLVFYYRAGWPGIPAEDSGILSIPDYMENLYTELLRAIARGWEDDLENPAMLSSAVAAVKAGPVYQHAVETDQAAQTQFGMPRGGVADTAYNTSIWVTGTGAPS